MSKRAFNTAVIDIAKSDRYFLTKHFHSAQSTKSEREAFVREGIGVSPSQSIFVTKPWQSQLRICESCRGSLTTRWAAGWGWACHIVRFWGPTAFYILPVFLIFPVRPKLKNRIIHGSHHKRFSSFQWEKGQLRHLILQIGKPNPMKPKWLLKLNPEANCWSVLVIPSDCFWCVH